MAVELFDWIKALFLKNRVDSTNKPPTFMINRFLASKQMFAPFAAWASRNIRDHVLAYEWWMTALPRQQQPFLSYPAPKKGPAADALVVAVMERFAYNREDAEQAVELVEIQERTNSLRKYLGVERPKKKRRK